MDILGGHTEVTDAVTRPVTSVAVVARQARGSALSGMRPGDEIVLTKSAAVEGTAILAEDFSRFLGGVPAETLERAHSFSGRLSVVPESRLALQTGAHAMHDVTEGGVLGAVWEMAYAGGCAAEVFSKQIPVRPETAALCGALGLDPLRLIGSGSLLIAIENGEALVRLLASRGIESAVIGRAIPGGVSLLDGQPLGEPHADEIYRLYDRV